MKDSLIKRLIISFLFLTSYSCQGEEATGVNVTLYDFSQKNSIASIKVKFINQSNRDFWLYNHCNQHGAIFHDIFDIKNISELSDSASYVGLVDFIGKPSKEDFIVLKAREELVCEFVLTGSYAFPSEGDYEIVFSARNPHLPNSQKEVFLVSLPYKFYYSKNH